MEIGSDAHWIVRGRLLASRAPRGEPEVRALAQEGVTHILSLVENRDEPDWVREAGVEYLQSRMSEMGSPGPAEIRRALVQVLGALASAERNCVLVHCRAGVGRAGVVAAAYLGVSAGLTPEEAIREVRERRPGALWSQDKEVAVEDFLREFSSGRLRLEGERSCPRCETRILSPQLLCFRCSGAKTLDTYLGVGS